MSGSPRPIRCCDSDCAGANGCRIGGYQCDRCGEWYCPDLDGGDFYGTNNYVCAECAEERRKEADDGE